MKLIFYLTHFVSDPPQKPKDFDCVSYNWESFNCTWEPQHNFVHTSYNLMFQLPGRSGAIYYCPLNTMTETSCTWDIYTDPIYRQPYTFYIFILNVSNAFGNVNFTYRIQHYPNGKFYIYYSYFLFILYENILQ